MVYCGLYPSEGENFEELRDALEKLAINDPSFEYAPESSEATLGVPRRVERGLRVARPGSEQEGSAGAAGYGPGSPARSEEVGSEEAGRQEGRGEHHTRILIARVASSTSRRRTRASRFGGESS